MRGIRGFLEQAHQISDEQGLTLRELGKIYGRSLLIPQLVGTPTQIADALETLFLEGAGDGFIISPAYLPGSFTEFVEWVVPELQKRGLFRKNYAGTTLRHHLGLNDPLAQVPV